MRISKNLEELAKQDKYLSEILCDLKEAEKALLNSSFKSSIILAMTAVEKSLRHALGVPESREADMLDLMHFAKREGVWLPSWKALRKYRRLRNKCIHDFYAPSLSEAKDVLSFSKMFINKLFETDIDPKLKEKANKFFKRMEGKFWRIVRLTDLLVSVGALMFISGFCLLVLSVISIVTTFSPPPLFPVLLSAVLIPSGLGASIIGIIEKKEIGIKEL